MLTTARNGGSTTATASRDLAAHVAQLGSPMLYARNTEILREVDVSGSVFHVVSGAVRTCRLLADGRRHVGAFYLAGDVFGLESSSVPGMSVETTCNATIAAIERRPLLSQALQDTGLARALWQATSQQLRRTQRHMLLLAQSAQERVASFLLEMSERQGSRERLDLPMSRQDIADYLGLTIETVSRSLTQLEDRSIIDLIGARRVLLRNVRELRKLHG